jgi:Uma2 family endonuclease
VIGVRGLGKAPFGRHNAIRGASVFYLAGGKNMQAVRWTVDEYHQMADLGWFQGKRVELIDGTILERPVPNSPHVVAMHLTEEVLRSTFGADFWVRTQSPLNLGPASEPMPDIAVVPGKPRDYTAHPTTALLVVEIGDSSLSYDRKEKASLYARAGLADYWIVNLVNGQLEVCRDPVPDPLQTFGFGYSSRTILHLGDAIAPLAALNTPIAVADLLP